MKKLLLVGALSLIGVSSVCAQGTIDFRNRITGSVNTPVYLNSVGGTLLDGANFIAQLWYGTSATAVTSFIAPGDPFRTGTGAGFWNAGADSTRILNGITPNTAVWLQVKVWDSTAGATWDAAKAAGGLWGESNIFQGQAGGGNPAVAPGQLTGLQSFALVPEPSTIALGVLGAAALLLRRRGK